MCPETTMVTNMRSNKGFRISQISFGFHTFITFLRFEHKDIFNPKDVEDEGLEETAYPKPVLSELGFWALNTSSSFALDILSIWVLTWLSSTSKLLTLSYNEVFSTTRVSTNLVVSSSLTNKSAFSVFTSLNSFPQRWEVFSDFINSVHSLS